MRVLIAEDDHVSRRILETLVRKWGHEVLVAADGTQAWEHLQQEDAPSMIVLDWMMPGIDGVDVCRRLRELSRSLRPYVILLTGKGQKSDLVRGIGAGADDYVTKPFDPDELRMRIFAGERILNLQAEALAMMDALRKQASHDYLTGLPNRATIVDVLKREIARAPRTGQHVSVVMADVDHFKNINDTYGHPVGDAVLAEVAKRMAMEMRSYEHIGRFGGEEFVAVLSGCDTEGAKVLAERLRNAVAGREFDCSSVKVPVTASFGVASTSDVEDPTSDRLIQVADVGLYRAKRSGRNRVETAVGADATEMQPAPL